MKEGFQRTNSRAGSFVRDDFFPSKRKDLIKAVSLFKALKVERRLSVVSCRALVWVFFLQ
jgi:hypothetical protein